MHFENTLTTEQIQARAYELYLQRGAGPGRELDDWLTAEKELSEQRKSAGPAPRLAKTQERSEEEVDGEAALPRTTRSRVKRYGAAAGADSDTEKHKSF